ncbi:MAG TPA: AMP-binding protein [Acidimicrobiia bacterium]|nr:AMP-binding protein [Acidimicrobiia bacterium]
MIRRHDSLIARIEDAARTGGVVTFIDGDHTDAVEWGRLHEEALGIAADLQARGIAPGDHVALLGPTSRRLVTTIAAVWLTGAALVVLPLPMRLASIEEFVAQTRRRIHKADTKLLVADPGLLEFMTPEPGDPPVVTLPELTTNRAAAYERPPDNPDALAILQYTSGSTSDPKGVMLPHRCVAANLDGIASAARLDPSDDVVVSWLPLYHDMGLIGTLGLPITTGTDLVLAPPQDFLASPKRWMEWMSAFGGTATAGPNFSYALAARSLRRADTLDLSRWRLALNGAEPIDPAAVDAFVEAGRRHGLDPGAVFCAFGMAEATLAVTFPEPGAGMTVDAVDRRVLETDRYAAPCGAEEPKARRLALLGRPVPGIDVRIVDPTTGSTLGEREVGEIEIAGTSVTPGYYNDSAATEATLHDGWLRTGDLGYLVGGQLVVCGRIKDVIIMGGRNIFPEDAERAAAEIDGVRAGNVIAFGAEGRKGNEALVLVAEAKAGEGDAPTVDVLKEVLARTVRDTVGVPPREIVLVRPGTLPKTSSGKLQRSLCKERYVNAALERIG